jgi:hypothetical protein
MAQADSAALQESTRIEGAEFQSGFLLVGDQSNATKTRGGLDGGFAAQTSHSTKRA